MPAKFDRCVEAVQAQGSADNPYAVCRASLGSDDDIRRGRRPTRRGRGRQPRRTRARR